MTQQDKQWLDQNQMVFKNVRLTPEQNQMLFAIYNRLTGDNMKPTSCGRCVANAKKQVKYHYDQNRSND